MTLKEWMGKATYDEQKDLAEKLQAWLGMYTQEVIEHVMGQMDDIINNEMSMMMISELQQREQKEQKREIDQFYFSLKDIEEGNDKIWDIHSQVITHSNSYRDVLYDMYIRDRKRED